MQPSPHQKTGSAVFWQGKKKAWRHWRWFLVHIVSHFPVLQFSDTKSPSVSKDLSSFYKRKHRLAIVVLFHLADWRPLCMLSCWRVHEARMLIYGCLCPGRLTSITGRPALLISSQPSPGSSVVKSQQRRTRSLMHVAHLRAREKNSQDVLDTGALPSSMFIQSWICLRATDVASPLTAQRQWRGLCLRTLKFWLIFPAQACFFGLLLLIHSKLYTSSR